MEFGVLTIIGVKIAWESSKRKTLTKEKGDALQGKKKGQARILRGWERGDSRTLQEERR